MDVDRKFERPTTFGSLLRRHRLAAGLSQESLAQRASISVQAVGTLERGIRRTPHRETLDLLSAALSLSPEDRRDFEAAAVRPSLPRSRVVAAPWPTAAPGALPAALTSFIGRESEIADICALVRAHRLVTVAGPGGIGKTRTALEVAGAFVDVWPVRFIELGPVEIDRFVPGAVCSALGIEEVPNRSPLDVMRSHLGDEPALLLFDNCEHVIAEVARVAATLLRCCGELRVLATSREALHVGGERVFRLAPLSAPRLEDARALEVPVAARFPAVALFVDRARAVEQGFSLDAQTAPFVGEICARLDGIPLALELAAARTDTLSVRGLASRLNGHVGLLERAGSTGSTRQRTMGSVIAWSYELLTEPQQYMFEGLSVFPAGATLEGASAAAADPDVEEDDVLDLLSALIDKSLVLADFTHAEPRYRMLEPFRQFARERLTERGELDAALRRQAEAMVALGERISFKTIESDLGGSVRAELENWRVALDWTLGGRNDVDLGLRLAAALGPLWNRFGPAEGLRWVRLALQQLDDNDTRPVAARLLLANAHLSEAAGEYDAAMIAAVRGIELYRRSGNTANVVVLQCLLAMLQLKLGQIDEAVLLTHAAVDAARNGGDPGILAGALGTLAEVLSTQGDFEGARVACSNARALFERLDFHSNAVLTMVKRAEIERRAGDPEAALRVAREALTALGEGEFKRIQAVLQANMAAYCVALGNFEEACSHTREAIEIALNERLMASLSWALQHTVAIAALRAQPDLLRAALLDGYLEAFFQASGTAPDPSDREERERIATALAGALRDDELALLRARGADLTEDEAVELARGTLAATHDEKS